MELRKVYAELEKYKSETASLEAEVITICNRQMDGWIDRQIDRLYVGI